MSDMKPNEIRRKLLGSAATGSGAVLAGKFLPESWNKPIVDAVMIPAHAETTETSVLPGPCSDCPGSYCTNSGTETIEFIINDSQIRVEMALSIGSIGAATGLCEIDSFSIEVPIAGEELTGTALVVGNIVEDCSNVHGYYSVNNGTPVTFVAIPGSCS